MSSLTFIFIILACVKTTLTYTDVGSALAVSPTAAEYSLLNSGGTLTQTKTVTYKVNGENVKVFTVSLTVKNVELFTIEIWNGESLETTQSKVTMTIH
jgi:hypothetical protein